MGGGGGIPPHTGLMGLSSVKVSEKHQVCPANPRLVYAFKNASFSNINVHHVLKSICIYKDNLKSHILVLRITLTGGGKMDHKEARYVIKIKKTEIVFDCNIPEKEDLHKIEEKKTDKNQENLKIKEICFAVAVFLILGFSGNNFGPGGLRAPPVVAD